MLAYHQRAEPGPWFGVGRSLDGAAVYERLRADSATATLAATNGDTVRPYCVYVHVPFCSSICGFCALYTHAVAPDAHDVLDQYVELVGRSIASHPSKGPSRPPTTVHFGGGTPLFLGLRYFELLARALAKSFGTSPVCEWAVETTTSSCDPDTLDMLERLGIRRIHLGVQTLDDPTRARIGRHETGVRAVERIHSLRERGFFTSVDLIIGFDGVGPSVVRSDLRRLHEAGVQMFSVCELRERGNTRLGVRNAREKATKNYTLWQVIWDFMGEAGLVPIHLGQFGRTPGDNLYFTHPARGEDCVAIGPYAHGCAGNLYYANLLLPEYYDAIAAGRSPIATGVDYGDDARVVRALERDLLAHCVGRDTLEAVKCAHPATFPRLFDSWIEKRLLVRTGDGSGFVPTLDGSWFIGNMIIEARAMVGQPTGWQLAETSA
jgi:oxygen-independent coproporphyrinogen-3 oxidase